MSGLNKKSIIIEILKTIAPIIGVIYFGFTWLNKEYYHQGYNLLNNNIGQFTFFGFFILSIFQILKFSGKEKLFLPILISLFFGILLLFFIKKIFLWPFSLVILISSLFFLLRKFI